MVAGWLAELARDEAGAHAAMLVTFGSPRAFGVRVLAVFAHGLITESIV